MSPVRREFLLSIVVSHAGRTETIGKPFLWQPDPANQSRYQVVQWNSILIERGKQQKKQNREGKQFVTLPSLSIVVFRRAMMLLISSTRFTGQASALALGVPVHQRVCAFSILILSMIFTFHFISLPCTICVRPPGWRYFTFKPNPPMVDIQPNRHLFAQTTTTTIPWGGYAAPADSSWTWNDARQHGPHGLGRGALSPVAWIPSGIYRQIKQNTPPNTPYIYTPSPRRTVPGPVQDDIYSRRALSIILRGEQRRLDAADQIRAGPWRWHLRVSGVDGTENQRPSTSACRWWVWTSILPRSTYTWGGMRNGGGRKERAHFTLVRIAIDSACHWIESLVRMGGLGLSLPALISSVDRELMSRPINIGFKTVWNE